MNYFEAHKLLDKLKEGHACKPQDIRTALFLTGDRESPSDVRGEGMDQTLSRETENSWESQSISLVAQYSDRNRESQGQGSHRQIEGGHECLS